MIRLALAGAHTRLFSTLCGACPQGPLGCCASPPGVEWSDAGRIVARGGRAWLLAELASGRLRPGPRGLLILRAAPSPGESASPGEGARCVFHGPGGCTIAEDRRAATCNYYVCDDAFEHGGEGRGDPEAIVGRRAHEAIVDLLGRWDREIAERVAARWPEGPPWDADFLDWLGAEHSQLARRSRRELAALDPDLEPDQARGR